MVDVWPGQPGWDSLVRLGALRLLHLEHTLAWHGSRREEDYAAALAAQGGRLAGWRPERPAQQGWAGWLAGGMGGRRAAGSRWRLPWRARAAAGAQGAAPGGGAAGTSPCTEPRQAPPAPRFELAWLPRSLRSCSVKLPTGTRVVGTAGPRGTQAEQNQCQPPHFFFSEFPAVYLGPLAASPCTG